MAARGAEAKSIISRLILKMFPQSFVNDKEIRIPVMQDGEEIQIKITLTAAKDNIDRMTSFDKPVITDKDKEAVKIGPLTPEEKDKIIEQLRSIVDIDLVL